MQKSDSVEWQFTAMLWVLDVVIISDSIPYDTLDYTENNCSFRISSTKGKWSGSL